MEQERVSWSVGYTHQPRNFESIRLDLTLDGFREQGETLGEAADRVYKVAIEQLVEKLNEARRDLA